MTYTKADYLAADAMAAQAMPLVTAFDDAGEKISPPDRRVTYAALVMLMTTFAKSSETATPEQIMDDFRRRVVDGATAAKPTEQ